MQVQRIKDAAEKLKRLDRLNEMFDELSVKSSDYQSFALEGQEQPEPVRGWRLLRVVSEELQDVAAELHSLGVVDFKVKQVG